MKQKLSYPFLFLALVWMAIIFWFSDQSSLFALSADFWDTIFKKSAHAFAYGVLWWLWWRASGGRTGLALLMTVLYALSDEWHQHFVPGRHGQLFDVGVDSVGALLALLFVTMRQEYVRREKEQRRIERRREKKRKKRDA